MPKLSSEIVFVLYYSLFFKYIIIFLSEIISMKFTSTIKSILLLLVHLLRFIFNCGVRSSRTRNTRVPRGLKSLWSELSEERGTTGLARDSQLAILNGIGQIRELSRTGKTPAAFLQQKVVFKIVFLKLQRGMMTRGRVKRVPEYAA